MKNIYSGIFSIPVTPFNLDLSIDQKSLENCFEFLVDKGSHGMLIPANVSEVSKLSDDEKKDILKTATEVVKEEIPIIAGVSANNVNSIIENAKYAEGLGIQSVLMTPLLSFKHDSEFYDFYSEISRATNVNIWVQNNRPPDGNPIPPDILIRIINEIDKVDFLKEETNDSGHMHQLIKDKCANKIKSIMGGGGGRRIIDEYRRGSDGLMPSGHMIEAHLKLWNELKKSKNNQINNDAINTWNLMLESLLFELNFSYSAYKYFFWKRGVIKNYIVRHPIKSVMDDFDYIEADRIFDKVKSNFF